VPVKLLRKSVTRPTWRNYDKLLIRPLCTSKWTCPAFTYELFVVNHRTVFKSLISFMSRLRVSLTTEGRNTVLKVLNAYNRETSTSDLASSTSQRACIQVVSWIRFDKVTSQHLTHNKQRGQVDIRP